MSVTHLVLGAAAREVPVQMILGSSRTDPGALRPPLPPLRYALEPRPAHQARHPVAATPLAGVAQVLPDARTAHDAVLVGMQRRIRVSNRAFAWARALGGRVTQP